MKNWFIAVIAAVFLAGCSTLEVQVDYDPEYKFTDLSKFSVVYTNKNDTRDFDRDRTSRLLDAFMQEKGYTKVNKEEAEFYITMHLDVQKKSQMETNYETIGIRPMPYAYYGVGTPAGAYPGGIRGSSMLAIEPDMRVTTKRYEYEEGRLVLEIVDVKENRIVWQGIARDELSKEYSQEQKSEYLKKVISELFKDFPAKR